MAESVFRLSGEHAFVAIHVLGYENPSADTHSDANWLQCLLRAECDGFRAESAASLTAQDLAALALGLQELIERRSSKFVLETDEDQLRLEIELTMRGPARCRCRLSGRSTPRPQLSFEMSADMSTLESASRLAEVISGEFPVKQFK